jgi:hypothetical protein
MKKEDWVYLANAMWAYAEKHDGKISSLLKELVITINKNEKVINNDMGKYEQNATSNRPNDTNSTSNSDFTGLGEF